jgi:hypothetical protein
VHRSTGHSRATHEMRVPRGANIVSNYVVSSSDEIFPSPVSDASSQRPKDEMIAMNAATLSASGVVSWYNCADR